jgi:hypothetical protein
MQNGSFRWLEILICVASFALVTMLSDHFQARITYQEGRGWDGAYYYEMAEQAARGESIRAESPYVYRVGLPIAAAMLSRDDLLAGFKQANLVANVLLLPLFMVWARVGRSWSRTSPSWRSAWRPALWPTSAGMTRSDTCGWRCPSSTS